EGGGRRGQSTSSSATCALDGVPGHPVGGVLELAPSDTDNVRVCVAACVGTSPGVGGTSHTVAGGLIPGLIEPGSDQPAAGTRDSLIRCGDAGAGAGSRDSTATIRSQRDTSTCPATATHRPKTPASPSQTGAA